MEMSDISERVGQFLKDNPVSFGVFAVLIGVFGLLGAVFDWDWLFGNVSGVDYNLGKVDGLVNFFGRPAARVIFGASCFLPILCGVVLIWLCRVRSKL
ncbi:MAG: Imm17 family immunity protein [Methanomassiliicoccaceae archaeon]|nr:Imm17 family immunity protein [Methanomassiliicoccaceae archaeon]